MKIIDIKDKGLRELAEKRKSELPDKRCADTFGFKWSRTTEGYVFWHNVSRGIITELPNKKVVLDTYQF